MRSVARLGMTLVLLLSLTSCLQGRLPRLSSLPESGRQQVWARYVSYRTRASALAGASAADLSESDLQSFIDRLHQRFSFTPSDLEELSAEADRRDWLKSAGCTPPASPIFSHSLVVPPIPLSPPAPEYTASACGHQTEGTVILDTVIGPDGRPDSARVLKGLPDGLDEQAVSAVMRLRYYPALLCGRPVAVHYHLAVPFRLPCRTD